MGVDRGKGRTSTSAAAKPGAHVGGGLSTSLPATLGTWGVARESRNGSVRVIDPPTPVNSGR